MARSTILVAALVFASAALVVAPPATASIFQYDVTITSFDGTALAATVFLPSGASPSAKVPFVLMTHGWAGERATSPTDRVAALLNAGYGVLTWDSRGFGASGGEVMLNSPDFEVRDVQAIIDYVAWSIPSAQTTSRLDPVIGMTGGSYAGGIQLLAAAHDPRIDVIAPEITWNDLVQSLAPNGVPKLYWTSLLFSAGLEASCVNARNGDVPGAAFGAIKPIPRSTSGCQTSALADYYARVHATNGVPDDVRAALLHRSPATYMDQIDVPTLLVQGFPDTLFDVNQAIANYEGIKANGAPVKLWLYDGGHGHPEGPALPNTQATAISAAVVTWFDRHLKGDTNVNTGPEVEYFVDGAWHAAASWPPPSLADHTAHIAGLPSLVQGPVVAGNPSTATFPLAAGPLTVAGDASIAFDVMGLGTEAIGFVALAIQNGTTITRLNAQVQPFRTNITAETPTAVAIDLVNVAGTVPDGSTLILQVVSWDRDYNGNRVPGWANIERIDVAWQTH